MTSEDIIHKEIPITTPEPTKMTKEELEEYGIMVKLNYESVIAEHGTDNITEPTT